MIEQYISVRKAVAKQLLSEKDCVYAVFLLTIVLKKCNTTPREEVTLMSILT